MMLSSFSLVDVVVILLSGRCWCHITVWLMLFSSYCLVDDDVIFLSGGCSCNIAVW